MVDDATCNGVSDEPVDVAKDETAADNDPLDADGECDDEDEELGPSFKVAVCLKTCNMAATTTSAARSGERAADAATNAAPEAAPIKDSMARDAAKTQLGIRAGARCLEPNGYGTIRNF